MYRAITIALAAIVAPLAVFGYASGVAAAELRTGHVGDTLWPRGSDMTQNIVNATVKERTTNA